MKWPWAQGGQVQRPECGILASNRALVMNGSGAREVTTASLDLRNSRYDRILVFAMYWF